MPCTFLNATPSDIADMLVKNKLATAFPTKIKTAQEGLDRLEFLTENFEQRDIEGEHKYGVKGQEAQTKESFTTEAKRKFEKVKGKKKAEEISNKRENIIKRDAGIRVHAAINDITLAKLRTKYKDRVLTTKYRTPATKEAIQKDLNIPDNVYNKIDKLADAVIKHIIGVQDKIDPKGKVTIVPEQILVQDKRLGGTSDIVAIFSDGTALHFDYKTMTPSSSDVETVEMDGTMEARIVDPSWIAFYHYDDWSMQLPKTTAALQQTLKTGIVKQSRVIPIHLEFWYDQNKQLTDKIKNLRSFADDDYMLDMIPVQEETEDAALNARVNQMLILRHNLQKELDGIGKMSERAQHLKGRIDRINLSLNKLIVRRDIRNIIHDYTSLVHKFVDINSLGAVEGLKAEVLDEASEHFLRLDQLLDLHSELEVLQAILATTSDYYKMSHLSEEEIAETLALRRRLADNTNDMLSALMKEMMNRMPFTKAEWRRMENFPNIRYLSRWTKTLSEINHPAFQRLFEKGTQNKNKVLLATEEIRKEILNLVNAATAWGNSHGYKGMQVFDRFIDSDTGNLYHKLSKEFYEKRNEAIKKGNGAWLREHYQLKKDAQEIFDNTIKTFVGGRGLDPKDPNNSGIIQRQKELWSVDKALFNELSIGIYYELRDEYKDPLSSKGSQIHSKGYTDIYREEPLRKFYEYWTETMKDCRWKLGFGREYDKIPDNFLPWMRAEIAERLFHSGGFDLFIENASNIFRITNDEQEYGDIYARGKVDPDTGEILSEVPRWFINPLINRKGEIDKTLKSRDLGKVLFSMVEVAYNYEAMKSMEAEMDVLTLLLEQPEFGFKQQAGKRNIRIHGGGVLKFSGEENEGVKLFRKHVNFMVYGIKTQTKGEAQNWQKAVKGLNRYEVAVTLGMAPVLQIGASLSAKLNQYFEASKSFFFTHKQAAWAEIALIGAHFGTEEGKKVTGLINFIEPYEFTTEQKMQRKEGLFKKREKIGGRFATRLSAMNLPFILFRKGTAWINSSVMLAMTKQYGINEQGQVRNLKTLPEGTKSLYERTRTEGDNFIIDGIVDEKGVVNIEAYTQFRNIVYEVARGIHGEMSQDNKMAVNMNLFGQLLMTYKSWMPHLLRERIHKMEYEPAKQVITIGRFDALWASTEISEDNKQFLTVVGLSLKRILTLIADVGTFMIPASYKAKMGMFRTSRDRLEQMYEQFKAGNLDLDIFEDNVEAVTKAEFMRYFDGQIRAMVTELRVVLSFIGAVAMLGFAFDDDDEDGKLAFSRMNWAQRQAYRLVNRIGRELGFFYGSSYIDVALQNPIPVTNVLLRARNIIRAIDKDIREQATGTEDRRRRTNAAYYGFRALPYNKLITSMFEPSPQEKAKQY